jgi:hypothetical protein
MRLLGGALALLCAIGASRADPPASPPSSAPQTEMVSGEQAARVWLNELLANLDLPDAYPAKANVGAFSTKPFATAEIELCRIVHISLNTEMWHGKPPKVEQPTRLSGISAWQDYFYLSDPDHIDPATLTADHQTRCRSEKPWSGMIAAKYAHDVDWGFTVLRAMLKQAATAPRSIVFDCDSPQHICAAELAKTDVRKLSSVEMCNDIVDGGCFEYLFDGRHLNVRFSVEDGLFGSWKIVVSQVRSRYDYIIE